MPSALKTLTTEGRSPSGEAERPYREIAVVIIVKVARAGPAHVPLALSMSPEAPRLLRLLWWIPVSPIVGDLLGSLILSGSWPGPGHSGRSSRSRSSRRRLRRWLRLRVFRDPTP